MTSPLASNPWYCFPPCDQDPCPDRDKTYNQIQPPIPHFHSHILYFRVKPEAMSDADLVIEYLMAAQKTRFRPCRFASDHLPSGYSTMKVDAIFSGKEEIKGLTRQSTLQEITSRVFQTVYPKALQWISEPIQDPTVDICDS